MPPIIIVAITQNPQKIYKNSAIACIPIRKLQHPLKKAGGHYVNEKRGSLCTTHLQEMIWYSQEVSHAKPYNARTTCDELVPTGRKHSILDWCKCTLLFHSTEVEARVACENLLYRGRIPLWITNQLYELKFEVFLLGFPPRHCVARSLLRKSILVQ